MMSFEFNPYILLVEAGGVFAAGLAILAACLCRSRITRVVMIALALLFLAPAGYVFLALHPELVDARFRTYKKFHRDIQIGMTREQVLAVMENHYPANGPRQRPKIMADTPEALGFFMNPETSHEPNSAEIFLKLKEGRVTEISYSAD